MISKEAFIEEYCKGYPTARPLIESGKLLPMPCNCEEIEGEHWAMVTGIDLDFTYITHIAPCIWRWRDAKNG